MRYFPITPHLRGSRGTDDDTFMDEETTRGILNSWVLVQEKVDGLNIGLCLDQDGTLLLVQKDRVIDWDDDAALAPLHEWSANQRATLAHVLADGLILFGEYLSGANLAPRFAMPWVLFDGFDRGARRFLSQEELRRRTSCLHLPYVPTVFEGVLIDLARVQALIGPSHVGAGSMEGIYLRIEDRGYLKERYKFVRGDYVKQSR